MKPQIFDMLLCAGEGRVSRYIRRAQRLMGWSKFESRITHLAMKARNEKVFESTSGNTKWSGKRGVQVNDFDEWLRNYNGAVWYRPITALLLDDVVSVGTIKMQSLVGRDYESGIEGILELIKCILPNWIPIKRTFKLHCTEADAEVYQELGWMKRHITHKGNNGFSYMEKVLLHKLPPAMWWKKIDKIMDVQIGEPILLKG